MLKRLALLILLSGCSEPASVSMVGDSIIAQAAPFTSAQNLGISGATTEAIKATIGHATARLVIIEGGVNDFLLGTEGQIVGNYRAMLQSIPDKAVTVVGILPVDWPLLNTLRPDLAAKINNVKIADVNAQLTTLCLSFANCKMAPRFDVIGKTSDGMHLTAVSYPDFLASVIR